jgi:Uma2 family endonuclease
MGTPEQPSVRRFTTDEAIRMVELGIVGEDEHVELLGGALVEMSPQGPPHAFSTIRLAERFRAAYAGVGHVREEKPLTASEYDLPEPDIALVRGAIDEYAQRHPTGRDAILIVELALTSQRIDRRKAAIYAAAGVEVYWLLDLVARRLEVRTVPESGAYQITRVLSEDDVVELPESTERWVVRELLPESAAGGQGR